MSVTGKAHYAINDLSVDWDESTRRKEKPCAVCGQPTRGRMKNGGGFVEAAHMACAFRKITDKAMKVYTKVAVLLLAALLTFTASAQTDIIMRGYTADRNGWNSHETTLTQAKIIRDGLRLIPQGPIPLFGDEHGTEGTPLIAHGIKTAKGTRNLVLTANSADYVQAFDSTTGEEIWRTSLGTPVLSNQNIDSHLTNSRWGCLATGAYWKGLLYEDCQISTDKSGNPSSGRYYWFVIDPSSGKVLAQVSSQNNNRLWKKRGSLLPMVLSERDTVCDTFGSINETSDGFTGGMTCLDVATRTTSLFWPDSAGHWNGGEGPVLDKNGGIHLMSGNGAFAPERGWFGESFLRGLYVFDGKNPATFTIPTWFSPYTDFWRSGQADPYATAPKLSGVNALSEEIKTPAVNAAGDMTSMGLQGATVKSSVGPDAQISVRVYPDPVMAKGGNSDLDLGSGGYVYVAEFDEIVGGGKDGLLYVLPAQFMGNTTNASIQDHHANCKNLVGGAPVYATAYVADVDPCTDNARELNFLPYNGSVPVTAHLHMTPVIMRLNGRIFAFVWGENFTLHEWELHKDSKPTYVTESNEFASIDVRNTAPGGMTGGNVTGCSNGSDPSTYLLAATIPYGDANNPRQGRSTAARLLVYDPVNRDATGHLKLLWDSQKWGIQFAFDKFTPPVCADGRIWVPTGDGRLLPLM